MTRIFKFFIFCLLFLSVSAFAQERIYLWTDIPGMTHEKSWICHYAPEGKNITDAAVIICPGGSYHHLGIGHEGHEVARWFADHGISAFVLKYRVAMNGYHHPAMIEDIQRAFHYVRSNAAIYGISPDRVGAIGFSAGGHLVTMAAFTQKDFLAPLGIVSRVPLTPDFVIPVYPVVSMCDDLYHRWSRISLIGRDPSDEQKAEFSMEKHVPEKCPPFLIVTARDDRKVDYRNSEVLDLALSASSVPHRFILLEHGGHGFGMDNGWDKELENWLATINILN